MTDPAPTPIGTWRRLRSLQWIGYSPDGLAALGGLAREDIVAGLRGETLPAATRAQIAALWDVTHMRLEPPTPLARAMHREAVAAGAYSPLAWDPETIDSAATRPEGVARGRDRSPWARHDRRRAPEGRTRP